MAKINILTSGIRGKFDNPVIGSVDAQDVEPDRGFSECCYVNYAFGDSGSSDPYFNDLYGGHIFKRQQATDTIVFEIIKNGVPQPFTTSHGRIYDFGEVANQPELRGIQVEWKAVLATLGEGKYQLKATINGTTEILSNTFVLRQFSWELANKTVRFDAIHNNYLEMQGLNLTGTNWPDRVRVRGFFGRREVTIKKESFLDGFLNQKRTETINEDVYNFTSDLIPECISTQLIDKIFLADGLKVSDYNGNNHSYCLKEFDIEIDKANKPKYWPETRRMKMDYSFSRKRQWNRSLKTG